ncbi:MAG: TerB family tellurite resistance protein [Cocleimonas sp.]
MLDSIKNFFEKNFISESPALSGDSKANDPQLALAALMIEVAEADFEDAPEEQQAILSIVKASFNLKEQDAEVLIQLAKTEHEKSTDYFQFTRLINDNYSAPKKIELIENLWRIAFSDQTLDKYEEHVIRRISDLLYVSHGDFMAAKHRAQGK